VLVARAKEPPETTPEIEPPCVACIQTQEATCRAQLWCEEHSRRHVKAQLHYETPSSYGVGSMFIRP
jgi:hypothetical protein